MKKHDRKKSQKITAQVECAVEGGNYCKMRDNPISTKVEASCNIGVINSDFSFLC